MKYISTPEEAHPIANVVFEFMRKHGFAVKIEKALDVNAPYTTTLTATKSRLNILFETQYQIHCDQSIKELALWLHSQRRYAELFIATHRLAHISWDIFRDLDRSGIGLILVDDKDTLEIERPPKNPALIISHDPTLRFGTYEKKVKTCMTKFNSPCSFISDKNPRRDAARDMCEIVEGLTEQLAIRAVKRKHITLTEKNITDQDWSGQIDTLRSQKACATGKSPIIDDPLKIDLHSFRGIRNLLDHKTSSHSQEIDRQQQLAERMMMGPRLIDRLVKLKCKI
jgi:hypothetical protein